METSVYLAFILATSIMIALPGPSVLLTIANSISFGWKRGVMTVAGATVGISVQLAVAAVGLVSLLNTVVGAFSVLRWVGAAYLVYLGIRQMIAAGKTNPPSETDKPEKPQTKGSAGNVFVQGLVTTALNPKSLVFIAAFLPQFIDMDRPLTVQFFLIVPTFLAITFCVTSLWALLAGKFSELLKSRRAAANISRTSGILMILAGIGLSLARKGRS